MFDDLADYPSVIHYRAFAIAALLSCLFAQWIGAPRVLALLLALAASAAGLRNMYVIWVAGSTGDV